MTQRFLEHSREQVGDYDRIVFDEAYIAELRGRLDIKSPITVHWEWDYVKEVETLRALYERGKTAQWNVETDIDWSVPMADDEWLMPPEFSTMANVLGMLGADEATRKKAVRMEVTHGFSQLLHGEQAALQLCAQLVNCVQDMDAKMFAGQQVADECRHVEVFAKVLARKLGTAHPIDPNVKFLLDEMIRTDNWHQKAIGMQVLFEGVAMAIITNFEKNSPNPLIRQVMRMVARDEARHAAFGVLALKEELPKMSEQERNQLEDWTWKCLEVVANGLGIGAVAYVAPRFGLDAKNVTGAVFSSPGFWNARYRLFNHTVLPNLKKLGLITERTRAGYDQFKLLGADEPFPVAAE